MSVDGVKFYVNYDKLAVCAGSQVGLVELHGALLLGSGGCGALHNSRDQALTPSKRDISPTTDQGHVGTVCLPAYCLCCGASHTNLYLYCLPPAGQYVWHPRCGAVRSLPAGRATR
jgi:hypothetical protein